MSRLDEWEVTPPEKCTECGRPLHEHWRRRPCLVVPEEVEVLRASGEFRCETCGKFLYDHPRYLYRIGQEGSAVKGCDGRFYHL